jgi:putative ATP-dependent endonuclease of OLD family
MFLKQLKLWNFRKYGTGGSALTLTAPDLIVHFKEGLNLLIGENDSGKTAIIDAIKILLRTHSGEWIGLDENDFNGTSNRLRIECEFRGLTDEESSNFPEWLSWDAGVPFLIAFLEAEKFEGRVLPYDIRSGSDPDGTPLNASARDYLKTTYLRPLRDAKSELIPRRNSRLSQILRAHQAFKDDPENHYLVQEFAKFNTTIEKYFEGKRADDTALSDQGGKLLKDEIDKYLKDFTSMTSLFTVSEADLKQILERLELTFAEESNLGLGSDNLLFMSAELLHLNKQGWKGLRLGLIEEIEAHLHPQIQLRVIESLQALSSIQLILTTHSPNIGSKIDLEKLIICKGAQTFPMGKAYTALSEPDYRYLKRFLDVSKANLFFAKGVIFVEGWAEELLLPSLSKKIGINLTERGISVVNIGNTAFLRYSSIFKRTDGKDFNIPVSVITDLDVLPSEESTDVGGVMKGAKKRLEKETKYNGGPVKTFVSLHWTFEYCLALSPHLRKHLFEAVKMAGQEMTNDGYTGKSVSEDWATFSNGKMDDVLAFDLFSQFIGDGKKISKAIIAQNLANILDSLTGADEISPSQLQADANISYIIKAIEYASGIS